VNASLRDLRRHADETTPPPFDVDDLVARGDARLRRRRTALAVVTASLAVVAIVAGVAVTDADRRSEPPVGTPSPQVTRTDTPAPTPAVPVDRPLTYTDDYVVDPGPAHYFMQSFRYGDRVVRPGLDVTALDLTDDGLVLLDSDGGVHLADGTTVQRIGRSTVLEDQSYLEGSVRTSSSGSLVAWLTPPGPDRSLVVYDTRERRVLAEVPRPGCDEFDCDLAVVGDRVYWATAPLATLRGRTQDPRRPLQVLDLLSERVSATTTRSMWEYLRGRPRGFVEGDSFGTGPVVTQHVHTGEVVFEARGRSLELKRWIRATGADLDGDREGDGPVIYGYGGFDTTGRRLDLRLPRGYAPTELGYTLFQWLDDDRFAVVAYASDFSGGDEAYGDILVCDIGRGRCTLAAPGPTGGLRLVPHLTLPN
jgi:hypothetical protein